MTDIMSKMQQTHKATASVTGVGKAGRQQQQPGKVPPGMWCSPQNLGVFRSWLEKALNNLAWSDGRPGSEQEAELHISRGRFSLEFSLQPTSAYDLTQR